MYFIIDLLQDRVLKTSGERDIARCQRLHPRRTNARVALAPASAIVQPLRRVNAAGDGRTSLQDVRDMGMRNESARCVLDATLHRDVPKYSS